MEKIIYRFPEWLKWLRNKKDLPIDEYELIYSALNYWEFYNDKLDFEKNYINFMNDMKYYIW